MINIQLENPSFEQYIKKFGKQEIEKMFLSFLEIKSKLNQLSKDNRLDTINVPIELHNKILAMKPTKEKEAEEINNLLDKMSNKMKDKNNQKPYRELRDEYFQERLLNYEY
ncbi:MAG: hypothetical protein QM493_05665 [Sulfurovum sp.]